MTYITFNPYSRKEEEIFDNISDKEVLQKLKKADEAYNEWSESSFEYRGNIFRKIAEILSAEREYHARIITTEMGKPIGQSIAEVDKCAMSCNFYADKAESFLSPIKMPSITGESYVRFDPLGTIFAIMPWNFPYWQVFRFLGPNLMLGNCGLLKHASNVPQCGIAIEEVVKKAGAPTGVFQNMLIDYKQAETVIAHDGVRGVTLTGSNYAGYKIAEIAGKYGKKTVLELGGSDPFIVFADADIQKAAETAIMARFQNTGQSCIASKRFFIHEEVYDEFLRLFIDKVESLKAGDPMDPETVIGPLAREAHLIELEVQISKMIDQGGRIRTGGSRLDKNSLILKPAVITDLPPDAPINQEELFGPVIPVFSFSNDIESVKLANNSPFGLGACIWTKDIKKAEAIAAKIETGAVSINGMVRSDPNLPFGGIKASGYGRELSEAGIKEFCNMKTISIYD